MTEIVESGAGVRLYCDSVFCQIPSLTNILRNLIMKAFEYFLNLTFFGTFIYSITLVSDNPAPIWLFTLTLSTIGLTLMFLSHIERK